LASEPLPKAYRIAAVPFLVGSAILLYFNFAAPSAAWLHEATLVDVAGMLALTLLGWRSTHHAKPPEPWRIFGRCWVRIRSDLSSGAPLRRL